MSQIKVTPALLQKCFKEQMIAAENKRPEEPRKDVKSRKEKFRKVLSSDFVAYLIVSSVGLGSVYFLQVTYDWMPKNWERIVLKCLTILFDWMVIAGSYFITQFVFRTYLYGGKTIRSTRITRIEKVYCFAITIGIISFLNWITTGGGFRIVIPYSLIVIVPIFFCLFIEFSKDKKLSDEKRSKLQQDYHTYGSHADM